jgi:hypothetical protein
MRPGVTSQYDKHTNEEYEEMSGRNFVRRHTRWINKRPRNNRATKDEHQKDYSY